MRLSILAALPLAACSFGANGHDSSPGVAGTGSGTARTFAIADFTGIDLRGSDDVDVRVGTGFSVRAEGPSEELDRLKIERKGDALQVGRVDGKGLGWISGEKKTVKIYVTMPRIAKANVAGSGSMAIDRVEGQDFDAATAGSGDLSVAALNVERGEFDMAGSGGMKLKGSVRRLSVSIAGSGDIDAGGVTSSEADVSIAGSGSVKAAVDGPAKVSIVGSGDANLGRKGALFRLEDRIGIGKLRLIAPGDLATPRKSEDAGGMLRFLSATPLLLLALPAIAADRTYSVGSFERIRVEGPFRVDLVLGKSPGAVAQGDMRNTDRLNIRVEGDTLIVSANSNAWQEQANAGDSRRSPAATIVRVSTPNLRGAVVIGGGQLTITGPLRSQRVDLSVTGTGALTATAIAADLLTGSVTGAGTLTLAGKATKTRLNGNGPTHILAEKLVADDLSVRTDGSGETIARARYTANVNAAGVGAVTVYGKPTCVVNKTVQGPISCGESLAP